MDNFHDNILNSPEMSAVPDPLSDSVDASIENPNRDHRRNSDGSRKVELTEIHALHHEIARLSALGITNVKIAEMCGCTPQTVSNTVNSPIVRLRIRELNAARDQGLIDQVKELENLVAISIDTFRDGLEKDSTLSPYQRVKLAGDLLDRTGHGKTLKIQGSLDRGYLDIDEINEIKRIAQERADANAAVIDVEPSLPEVVTSNG